VQVLILTGSDGDSVAKIADSGGMTDTEWVGRASWDTPPQSRPSGHVQQILRGGQCEVLISLAHRGKTGIMVDGIHASNYFEDLRMQASP